MVATLILLYSRLALRALLRLCLLLPFFIEVLVKIIADPPRVVIKVAFRANSGAAALADQVGVMLGDSLAKALAPCPRTPLE